MTLRPPARASPLVVAVALVLATGTTLAACGDDDASPTTTTAATDATPPTTQPEPEPPRAQMTFATLDWEDAAPYLDQVLDGLALAIEEAGLVDAQVWVLVITPPDTDPLAADLQIEGELVVRSTLVFSFASAVPMVMDLLEDALLYGLDVGPDLVALPPTDFPEGAVGYQAGPDGFARPVMGVAWPDGRRLHLAFAQGDDVESNLRQAVLSLIPSYDP